MSVHADQATGEIACDHWHEGSGFLTHHLALSVAFEMSLRAVDRRVTTPYWDFTIEVRLMREPTTTTRIARRAPDVSRKMQRANQERWHSFFCWVRGRAKSSC